MQFSRQGLNLKLVALDVRGVESGGGEEGREGVENWFLPCSLPQAENGPASCSSTASFSESRRGRSNLGFHAGDRRTGQAGRMTWITKIIIWIDYLDCPYISVKYSVKQVD